MTNAPGENAWPVTATNFILMYKKPKNVERAKATHDFFRWAYANGDAQAKSLDYVPLPEPLVSRSRRTGSANLQVLIAGNRQDALSVPGRTRHPSPAAARGGPHGPPLSFRRARAAVARNRETLMSSRCNKNIIS